MKYITRLSPFTFLAIALILLTLVADASEGQVENAAESPTENQSVSSSNIAKEMETLRQAMVNLNRDLFVLEEDLLFPASTQVSIFLGMDVGEYFKLDSVELRMNGEVLTHYLYTDRQVQALYRGGIQRLHLGNLEQGEHTVTAFFVGIGPEQREYKRAVSLDFTKSDEPVAIELSVIDSTTKQQPTFSAKKL